MALVPAWLYSLGPRSGFQHGEVRRPARLLRPADGQHFAAHGRMRGDVRLYRRRIGRFHLSPKVLVSVTKQRDIRPHRKEKPGDDRRDADEMAGPRLAFPTF